MKTVRAVVAVACVLGWLVVVGCGKAKQAVEVARAAQDAKDGNFTVTNEKGEKVTVNTKAGGGEGQSVTVTGPEGSSTYQSGAGTVKQEDVGIDFYPGATVEQGSTASQSGEKGGKGGKVSMVILSTTDGFADVAKFYKDKYAAGNTVIDQPGNLMITIKGGENVSKMIMVTADKSSGKTQITIHSGVEGM